MCPPPADARPGRQPIGSHAAAVAAPLLDLPGPDGGGSLPVLLLHGWTGSKEDFAPVVGALASRHRVLAPDLPGHGAAPPAADGRYDLAALVGVVVDLLDRLGVDEAHVVGHSHGGLVAQHLAARAAQRVASLVLIGSGLGALGGPAAAMVRRVARAAREEGMGAAWAAVGSDGSDPREAEARARFLAMDREALVGGATTLLTAEPLGYALRGIDVPVLVCHGEGDATWQPHEQQLLARRIAGARYAVVPDALHSPALENPDGLLALLRPFLAEAEEAVARRASWTRVPAPAHPAVGVHKPSSRAPTRP